MHRLGREDYRNLPDAGKQRLGMAYGARFEKSLVFAAQLHRTQVRKGTSIPYVNHLLATASQVGEAGGTEDEVIAALLHDAVEDQGGAPTLGRIRDLFGDAVAEIVQGCTDTDQIPKPPWKQRKEAYLRHLDHAAPSVLLVSCADKLHNARAIVADLRQIGAAVWERFSASKEECLWYYRSLAASYRRGRVTGRLVDELERVVQNMEDLAREG